MQMNEGHMTDTDENEGQMKESHAGENQMSRDHTKEGQMTEGHMKDGHAAASKMDGGHTFIEDNNAFLMAMGEDSRIEIHAADAAKDSWTQIDQSANAGDNTLTLSEATGWEVGDKIAIASTGFDMNEAEYREITAVSADGMTVTLDAPLEYGHYGEIETHTNGKTGEDFQSWELDMRAEVALLSRNVTIQGDAEASEDGYGGHTMIMHGASMHIDGAELTKMGQIGEVGRYPLHWHMLEDASGQYITNSSVHETYNKGVTIHGTWNTWLENNAIVDTIGHTYYFEDGSEIGNVLVENLGMNTVKSESVEAAAIGSDHTEVSTYWVTNPNNHLIGNHAAGSDDTGFWILVQDELQGKSFGDERFDDITSPRFQAPGTWEGNSSHSNVDDGLWIGSEFNEETGEKILPELRLENPFLLSDFTSFKNGEWGIWLRNGLGDFEGLKLADNEAGIQIWGDSIIQDSLFVGQSGNADDTLGQHVGWQMYDHPISFKDVHFAGFTGENDAAISNGWGFGRSAAHNVENLTFADDVARKYLHTLSIEDETRVSDQGGVVAGAIIDLDGSLTGIVGGVLTPGVIDYNPDKHFDIATYAFEGIEGAGFNASEGALWLAEERAWIHNADAVIGKMVIMESHFIEGSLQAVALEDRAVYTIERTDNGAKLQVNQDAMVSYSPHVQLNVEAKEGLEYIIDYADEVPDVLTVDLSELPESATALYRIKGLPDGVVFQEADAAATLDAFINATVTTWFQEENGDYVVKAVADRFLHWRNPRSETDVADERVYNDEFKLFINNADGIEPSGNGNPYTTREENPWSKAVPVAVPERAESTSDTVEIADGDPRWTEAATWDNGAPNADDIVIIGEGQRVVLDTDATVKAILVNGGELVVEDTRDIALAADWVLVINGGLFQVGTEDTPFEHDFDLTLEGDDASNDVDVAALLNSSDETVNRAVGVTPPETYEVTVDDENGDKPWKTYTDSFDADGVRQSREMTYDDGRVITTTYQDGVKASQVQQDLGDVKIWAEIARTFDAEGKLAAQEVRQDDGRVSSTLYANGVKASQFVQDLDDAKNWETISREFDESGAISTHLIAYDDGRTANTSYTNGVKTAQTHLDLGDAKPWTEIGKTFDENGKFATQEIRYDDGRTTSTIYEDGVKVAQAELDPLNAKSWSEISRAFDENGDIALHRISYDDGRLSETEYANGEKVRHITLDEEDAYSWSQVTDTYRLNSQLVSKVVIGDDETVTSTAFQGGAKIQTTRFDSADTFDWSFEKTTFDGEGQRSQTVKDYDDGRKLTTEFEGGVRNTATLEDTADAFAWTKVTTEFDKAGERISATTLRDDGTETVKLFQPVVEDEVLFIPDAPTEGPSGPTFFDPFDVDSQSVQPTDEFLFV